MTRIRHRPTARRAGLAASRRSCARLPRTGRGAPRTAMPPTRYSFIVADRATGHVRRFTLRIRLVASMLALAVVIPLGWGLQRHGAALNEISRLQAESARLDLENARYRTAAAALSRDIVTLQAAITRLSTRIARTNASAPPMDRIPRALRVTVDQSDVRHVTAPAFDLLSDLLGTVDHRMRVLQYDVARREAIAGALPTLWPADGWVSGGYDYRRDPFTGDREFHAAVDISTRTGEPVYATAHGRVMSAQRRRQLRQSDRDRPRFRDPEPLRSSLGVRGPPRDDRAARGPDWLRRRNRASDGLPRALRGARQRTPRQSTPSAGGPSIRPRRQLARKPSPAAPIPAQPAYMSPRRSAAQTPSPETVACGSDSRPAGLQESAPFAAQIPSPETVACGSDSRPAGLQESAPFAAQTPGIRRRNGARPPAGGARSPEAPIPLPLVLASAASRGYDFRSRADGRPRDRRLMTA